MYRIGWRLYHTAMAVVSSVMIVLTHNYGYCMSIVYICLWHVNIS